MGAIVRYLLDTNIIIYYLNDDPTAVALIEEHRHWERWIFNA